jgi:hypothetical protein
MKPTRNATVIALSTARRDEQHAESELQQAFRSLERATVLARRAPAAVREARQLHAQAALLEELDLSGAAA